MRISKILWLHGNRRWWSVCKKSVAQYCPLVKSNSGSSPHFIVPNHYQHHKHRHKHFKQTKLQTNLTETLKNKTYFKQTLQKILTETRWWQVQPPPDFFGDWIFWNHPTLAEPSPFLSKGQGKRGKWKWPKISQKNNCLAINEIKLSIHVKKEIIACLPCQPRCVEVPWNSVLSRWNRQKNSPPPLSIFRKKYGSEGRSLHPGHVPFPSPLIWPNLRCPRPPASHIHGGGHVWCATKKNQKVKKYSSASVIYMGGQIRGRSGHWTCFFKKRGMRDGKPCGQCHSSTW